LSSRVPLFNSPSRLKVAGGWIILPALGFGAFGVVVTATLPSTLTARKGQLERESRFALPGARLTYKETSRVVLPEGIGVTYKLQAEGLPQEKTYSLWSKLINGHTMEMYKGLLLDSSGHVLREDGAEFEFGLKKMLEGESVEYTLISHDETTKAVVEITPFPIEAQGGGKCHLSVKLLSAKGEAFLIKGEGFAAKQELKVVAKSDAEVGEFPLKVTDDGTFSMVILPAVLGKSGGEASFMAADTACAVTVRYKWGDAMTGPEQGTIQTAPGAQTAPTAAPQPIRPSGDVTRCKAAYTRQDYTTALKECRAAAEEGDADAQTSLGLMYDEGKGVKQDHAEAPKWYRKAADQGHANAQFSLGVMYDEGKVIKQDYAEALKWYRKAAEQGHAAAQNNLGVMYRQSKGVKQDYAEALRWFRKAADQGAALAQQSLGLMYEMGQGVEKDQAEALQWYRRAADQGLPDAQNTLGALYREGQGVEKDYAEALQWYRKAAEQGYALSQLNLGVMYLNGESVDQDYAEALKWFRKAADQGLADAQFNVGQIYKHGLGVPQDTTEALKWYRKAAAQGRAAAQAALR